MSTTQKFVSSSPYSSSNCSNVLQPKRLNGHAIIGSDNGGLNLPRRVLGPKGQLPLPVSHMSNQQLTTLLRSSPLIPQEGCSSGASSGVGGAGSLLINSAGPKRAPTTMAKRNARERNRVKQVNQGFQTLRQHIPESYRMKKMSKVDTLRCALDYIRNMERILQDDEYEGSTQYEQTGMPSSRSGGDSISPSTSISFSSEEDDYLVAAFSGDFTSSSNTASPLDNREQNKGLFESSRIILSSSPVYNDENNDVDLHFAVKLEKQEEEEEEEMSYDHHQGVLGMSSDANNPPHNMMMGENHSHLDETERDEDMDMVGVAGRKSQGRLRLHSHVSDGQSSDTENNYCPQEKNQVGC